jgi:hypothetical protein
MQSPEDKISELQEQLADFKESLFLSQQDEDRWRVENIALKNFIQTLYESCEGLEDTELTLEEVLQNLKENIRVFARDHNIRL